MQNQTNEIRNTYLKEVLLDSWDEQLKAASVKNPKQICWHPVMIKWCLNLKLLSTSAYHATCSSGFLTLPSERTLQDYSHYYACTTGFHNDIDNQLLVEIEQSKVPDSKSIYHCLLMR